MAATGWWEAFAFVWVIGFLNLTYAAGIALGAPPMLIGLLLAFSSSLMMSLTHYATGTAPIIFGSGYATLNEWWIAGAVLATGLAIVGLGLEERLAEGALEQDVGDSLGRQSLTGVESREVQPHLLSHLGRVHLEQFPDVVVEVDDGAIPTHLRQASSGRERFRRARGCPPSFQRPAAARHARSAYG